VAANDRYGLYPMYWARGRDRFCLASRVLCSVLAGVVEGEWDPAGVAQLLTTDDYLGETTLVRGVSAFPQATLLLKDENRLTWHRYWHYRYADRMRPDGFDETAGAIGEGLIRAVRRQTARAGRIGVTLSGGLDSRCLVAAASKADIPVQTFTWAQPGAYDREYAKTVAARYGTRHHDCDYAVEPFAQRFEEGMRITEGLIDYFDCHMLAHVDILGDHADLILNGYAGDLILGGSYLRSAWMKPMPMDDLAQRLFAWRNVLLAEADLGHALADSEALAPDQRPSVLFRRLLEQAQGPTSGDTVDRFVLENRVRRVTSMGTVIMRRRVESAAPFFDYDLVDRLMGVPPEQRAEHRIYKAMMGRTFPEALDLPWQRTLLRAGAPDWAAMASKGLLKVAGKIEKRLGFPRIASRLSPVDFAGWLRGPLKPWMDAVINEPHPTANEVLNASFCKSMWHDHLAGRDRTRMLGALAAVRGFSQALKRARGKARAYPVEPVEVWSPG
jgi:asparagine synthase (glutamine-hydrolysing)